jgi:4-hydroxy-tetrahydrodipicolinate synthase
VGDLARDGRVLGLKDSAGDFEAFLAYLAIKRARADFRLLQGHEALAAASLLQGADGLVPGLANVAPGLLGALRRAAARGDFAACARLQVALDDLGRLHARGHWLAALKAACALLGLGNGLPALPLRAATAADRAAIRGILARHRLLPARSRHARPRQGT